MSHSTSHSTIHVDPRSDPRWDALQVHGGGLFTSAPWLTAVAQTYDLEPSARLLLDPEGHVCAGVAFCDIDDLRGHRRVSFPYSDFHEPLGESLPDVATLLRTFVHEAPIRFKVPADRLPDDFADRGITARRSLLGHRIVVDSALDTDTRFSNLHPKVRQNIRRSRREGIGAELTSDLASLREFYELHVDVRTKKYRLLPQPFSFFEALHEAFAPAGGLTVALARHDGRAIVGIVYIEVGDTLYYKFNASDAEHLGVRPNEELVWSGIELCAQRGLSGIDLGVSEKEQDGLVRYKRKLAQEEREVVTLGAGRAPTDRVADHTAEVTHLLTQLTELLTADDVPRDVAERAGALLYRYFV